ncbi:hypothetical protein F5X68DRAFT_191370 [Plectosphaerella plurivora]|uniref:Homeobox domain-containing protein n=1 Tax=Plectosphaerella plurivora TaxID=936078 RepID=A0A9P8VCD7_9PEZI|nr:hypothetical protein F5X68DRAFT_191370 [Plectosphaerella plurivora]
MSSHFDSQLSSQTDWQGHYPCLAPDASGYSQTYGSGNEASDASRPRSTTDSHGQNETESNTADSTHLTSHPSLDTLDSSRTKPSSLTGDHQSQNQADAATAGSVVFSNDGSSSPSHNRQAVTMSPELMDAPKRAGSDGASAIKEEDDDLLDDDEDLDGEVSGRPMTAAERTAQRRKMKRFRLTHQQTRFLMSEFAKQPHPDAAHRERLSREIPGLSPRQVQVWFQNRRAKIKRLTADDRDRMIKMRAVPDDFDNVQALHSPYGAVHGLGTPMASPVNFGDSSYAEHMMRPLVIDVRRADGESHMSSTGLSPAFGNIGFNPSASMSNPDLLTPMSPSPGDHRYGYGTHGPSPLSPARPTHTFGRQATLDNSMLQSRHINRPIQPLHLRDSIRSRSDNLHSPLRTGMSWKGDSIDYTTYPGGNTSPQMTGRQQSMYQPESLGAGPSSSGLEYESSHSMNYPGYQSSSLQPTTQSRLRSRAASATLPLGLDLRNQYRSSHSTLSSSSHATSRDASSAASQFTGTSATTFSSSFPSAPLTAPIDFTMPRTPASATHSGRPGVHDFSMPQMSAPIAPPNDFAQAFDARTPMRDTFASGDHHGVEQHRGGNAFGGEYSTSSALKRKRSFTVPGTSTSATGASLYGHQG